jgi:hypothetical protein
MFITLVEEKERSHPSIFISIFNWHNCKPLTSIQTDMSCWLPVSTDFVAITWLNYLHIKIKADYKLDKLLDLNLVSLLYIPVVVHDTNIWLAYPYSHVKSIWLLIFNYYNTANILCLNYIIIAIQCILSNRFDLQIKQICFII